MKRILTIMKNSAKILPVGETDVSFAEEQLTGDNQLKATNCRWAGGYNTCHPILRGAKIIQSLVMPEKTSAARCLMDLPKARPFLNRELDLSDSR
jgi:hypothetical protein